MSEKSREQLMAILARLSLGDTKMLQAELDAAEERGRRAGIEAHIRDLHAIENALDEFEADPTVALRVVGEHVGMALHNLRDLAPRDSGKDTDHG